VITEKIHKFNDDLLIVVMANKIDLTDAINSAIQENYYNEKVVIFLKNISSL